MADSIGGFLSRLKNAVMRVFGAREDPLIVEQRTVADYLKVFREVDGLLAESSAPSS